MRNKMKDRREDWKQVVGYPDYKVSNYGRIRSYVQGNPRVLR
jgi:hypothetical protein